MRIVYLILALTCVTCLGSDWYVSTNGTGDGSIGNPWHLQTAIASGSIQPGDTVWLRGGVHFPTQTSIYLNGALGWGMAVTGSSGNPVTFRAYSNELVSIDRRWVMKSFIRFRDLEFFDSNKGLYPTNGMPNGGKGPWVHFVGGGEVGCEWINCLIHDIHNAFSFVYSSETVRGCVMWNIGWSDLEHVFYPNPLACVGNIIAWPANRVFNNSADVTTIGYNGNTLCASNIIFGAGVEFNASDTDLVIGNYQNTVAFNYLLSTNASLQAITASGSIIASNVMCGIQPMSLSTTNSTIESNTIYSNSGTHKPSIYFIGTTDTIDYNAYFCKPTDSISFATNGTYGVSFSEWQGLGFDTHGTSANTTPGDSYMIVPSQDQTNRIMIGIFNWSNADNVSVNLSGFIKSGATYSLISAQNYLAGPIGTGTFGGSVISVPMTNLTVAPILYGGNQNYDGLTPVNPSPVSPSFGAFMILSQDPVAIKATLSGATIRGATL